MDQSSLGIPSVEILRPVDQNSDLHVHQHLEIHDHLLDQLLNLWMRISNSVHRT